MDISGQDKTTEEPQKDSGDINKDLNESKNDVIPSPTEQEKEEIKEKILLLKNEGNDKFKLGNYADAIINYSEALALSRVVEDTDVQVILNSNLAAAHDHLEQSEEAITFCTEALNLKNDHAKALLRRAALYKKCDKLDESLADYKRYSELVPSDKSVQMTIVELQNEINVRNEKMKEEVMNKMKGLGNMILKPFGLSTNNFQMVKNEETGGYSINFKNNE